MDEALSGFLTTQVGEPVEINSRRRISFEDSRAVYDLETSAGRFVMRMLVDGAGVVSIGDEFGLMQSLHAAGVPVPNARWCEATGGVIGRPFFLSDHVDARRGSQSDPASDPAAPSLVKTLADLHALTPEDHLPAVDGVQIVHIQIEHWRNIGREAGGVRVPLLDSAEMFLHQRIPLIKRLALVHGKPSLDSALLSGDEVQAMIDWEYAHIGDPIEDWTYCATREGTNAKAREWRTLIERETGLRIGDDEWTYWLAFNLFKEACISRVCLSLFEKGVNRTPRMAIIGTAGYHSQLRRLMNLVE
jgi:aminoglycoside phosphotransferase (APT) family kinase protein